MLWINHLPHPCMLLIYVYQFQNFFHCTWLTNRLSRRWIFKYFHMYMYICDLFIYLLLPYPLDVVFTFFNQTGFMTIQVGRWKTVVPWHPGPGVLSNCKHEPHTSFRIFTWNWGNLNSYKKSGNNIKFAILPISRGDLLCAREAANAICQALTISDVS